MYRQRIVPSKCTTGNISSLAIDLGTCKLYSYVYTCISLMLMYVNRGVKQCTRHSAKFHSPSHRRNDINPKYTRRKSKSEVSHIQVSSTEEPEIRRLVELEELIVSLRISPNCHGTSQ